MKLLLMQVFTKLLKRNGLSEDETLYLLHKAMETHVRSALLDEGLPAQTCIRVMNRLIVGFPEGVKGTLRVNPSPSRSPGRRLKPLRSPVKLEKW